MRNDRLYSLINLGYRIRKKKKTKNPGNFLDSFKTKPFCQCYEYSEIAFM